MPLTFNSTKEEFVEFGKVLLKDSYITEEFMNNIAYVFNMNIKEEEKFDIGAILCEEYHNLVLNSNYNGLCKIFRTIKLSSLDDIDIDNFGICWSFKKEGANVYYDFKQSDFIFSFTGVTNKRNIDVEKGLKNFLINYGEYECRLFKGVSVIIIELDGKPVPRFEVRA